MFTISLAMALPLSLVGVPLVFSICFAPIFFMVFKYTKTFQRFALPLTIKYTMQFAICAVILWVLAQFIATKVPGGGAGYMVNYYAKYTILPAVGLLLVLDFILIFKEYGENIGQIAVVIAVVAIALRVAVPYLTQESQWETYCETAVDEFNVSGENIQYLEFLNFVVSSKYVKTVDNQVRKSIMESPGQELLRRGVIKEYERIFKNKPQRYRLILEENKEVETPTNQTFATHRISSESKNYSNGPGTKSWITRETISISNLKTGNIVAQRVLFVDPFNGNRSCAQTYSATDFIEKAIVKSKALDQANH